MNIITILLGIIVWKALSASNPYDFKDEKEGGLGDSFLIFFGFLGLAIGLPYLLLIFS